MWYKILFTFILVMTVQLANVEGCAYHPSTINSLHINPSSASITKVLEGTSNYKLEDSSDLTIAFIGLIGAIAGIFGTILAALISGWLPHYLEHRKIIKGKKKSEKEKEIEIARNLMLQARTEKEFTRAYRKAILADPNIAKVQILDMARPLNINDIYVRLRVHHENVNSYKVDSSLLAAETKKDPNILIQAEKTYLERRVIIAQDPEDTILKYRLCIIVGDPGAGKTTLLKYLTLKTASHKSILPNLPIRIELSAFSTSGYDDLLKFTANSWKLKYNFPEHEAYKYIVKNLEEGNATLLLDALDETVIGSTPEESENSYKKIIRLITDLSTCYQRVPIVVTGRKAGYYQRSIRLQGFTELEILDFRTEDIKHFIDQWFAEQSQKGKLANAEDLKLRLERNSRLMALAANPLLLSLITIVYEEDLDLPDKRTELYKQCVDILLTRWDANRNIIRRREFKPEQKRQLLHEVAWHFHGQGQRYFSERELLAVIANFLPAIGLSKDLNIRILKEIASENGLLKEQAHGWHGFLHLTLQEYFVAQYINDHNLISDAIKLRHRPWWQEVILLYAGITYDASDLIQALLEGDKNRPLSVANEESDLLLAARTLTSKPTIRQAHLREEVVKRLFSELTKTQKGNVKQTIAEFLVEINGENVNERLLLLLGANSVDLGIRQCIVYSLIRQKRYYAIRTLLNLLCEPSTDIPLWSTIAHNLPSLNIHGICTILNKEERQKKLPLTIAIIEKIAFSKEKIAFSKPERIASGAQRLITFLNDVSHY